MDETTISTGGIVFLVVIAWAIVFGWLGSWVAKQCGRDIAEGFILGVLFGPLGVVIEALLPRHYD